MWDDTNRAYSVHATSLDGSCHRGLVIGIVDFRAKDPRRSNEECHQGKCAGDCAAKRWIGGQWDKLPTCRLNKKSSDGRTLAMLSASSLPCTPSLLLIDQEVRTFPRNDPWEWWRDRVASSRQTYPRRTKIHEMKIKRKPCPLAVR